MRLVKGLPEGSLRDRVLVGEFDYFTRLDTDLLIAYYGGLILSLRTIGGHDGGLVLRSLCAFLERKVVVVYAVGIVCIFWAGGFLSHLSDLYWILITHLIAQLGLHLVSQQVKLGRVNVGVHLASLSNERFWSDGVPGQVVGHASLAVRHVYLEGRVTSLGVQ